jgi:hypothetical protein
LLSRVLFRIAALSGRLTAATCRWLLLVEDLIVAAQHGSAAQVRWPWSARRSAERGTVPPNVSSIGG